MPLKFCGFNLLTKTTFQQKLLQSQHWAERIATALQAGRTGVRFPVRGDFSHLWTRQDRLWGPTPAPNRWNGYRDSFPRSKAIEA
jgi:hypothetical protein